MMGESVVEKTIEQGTVRGLSGNQLKMIAILWQTGSPYHVVYGLLQYGIIIVCPFMHFYNGTRGKAKWMKCFF